MYDISSPNLPKTFRKKIKNKNKKIQIKQNNLLNKKVNTVNRNQDVFLLDLTRRN